MLVEDGLVENAAALEAVMWRELAKLDSSVAHTVRGRGLFFGIVITPTEGNIHPPFSPSSSNSPLPPPPQASMHGMCVCS